MDTGKNIKTWNKKYRWVVPMILFQVFVILCARSAFTRSRQNGVIFFYNSEINIKNFVSIKLLYDKYLSQYGFFTFQPFDNKRICEETFRKINLPSVLIITSWHFRSLNKKIPLVPLLISTRNGKNTFKKVLSVHKPLKRIQDLSGKVVASSASVEHTQNLLLEMLGRDKAELLSTIRILQVPKDIDALLAISYNIAHGAVTTQESLKLMERLNTGFKRNLNILLTSRDIFMPVAVTKKNFRMEKDLKKMIHIMKEMKFSEDGKEKLSALSIDGWTNISPEIMEVLKK